MLCRPIQVLSPRGLTLVAPIVLGEISDPICLTYEVDMLFDALVEHCVVGEELDSIEALPHAEPRPTVGKSARRLRRKQASQEHLEANVDDVKFEKVPDFVTPDFIPPRYSVKDFKRDFRQCSRTRGGLMEQAFAGRASRGVGVHLLMLSG